MSFCIIDGFDNRLLGEKLLLLLKKFPAVLMNQATDVMEFIYITSNIYGRQDFYGNLVFYQLFFTYECLAKKFVLFMIFIAQALMIIVFRLNNSYYFFFRFMLLVNTPLQCMLQTVVQSWWLNTLMLLRW